MNKIIILIRSLLIALIVIFLPAYSCYAANNPTPPARIQLAFFVGYHDSLGGYTRPGDPYFTPKYRERVPTRITGRYVQPGGCQSCSRGSNPYSKNILCNNGC